MAAEKRSRTAIPRLAGVFIDAYVEQYKSNHAEVRKSLVASIKTAMDAQDPSWALSKKVIETRLATTMKKANRLARLATEAEEEAARLATEAEEEAGAAAEAAPADAGNAEE